MNDTIKYILDGIEENINAIFTEEQEREKRVVIRVIAGLRNTDKKYLLEMDKHTLTWTFLYNYKATRKQNQVAVQLSTFLNDKLAGLWDVSTSPTD